jgi:hypothetical protein
VSAQLAHASSGDSPGNERRRSWLTRHELTRMDTGHRPELRNVLGPTFSYRITIGIPVCIAIAKLAMKIFPV